MERFFKGFSYAVNGLIYTVQTQLNFRVHLVVAVLVCLAGCYFKLSATEWILITMCIVAVLFAELVNTSIEVLVNLVSPSYNKQAGLVKDVAAAAVLVVAVMALVVGLIIFVHKL